MLRDVIPGQDDAALHHLLAFSLGFPTPTKIEQGFARYRHEPGWHLLGYEVSSGLAGSIGLQLTAPGKAVIHHIAVLPSHRGQGIGRQMVQQVWARFGLHRLTAETDAEAVEFYRRCGFAITNLGEVYPGTERFACELTAIRWAELSNLH